MRRLNVLAEGQTEEAFVNEVLSPHLADYGVVASVRCVTTRRDRRRPDIVHRGGLPDYAKARRDLERWMAEDGSATFTTMFDLYALPEDFPGYESAARLTDPYDRVRTLESAMAADIGDWRLIPYSSTSSRHSCSPTRRSWTGSTWSTPARSHGWSSSRADTRAPS